MTLEKLLVLHEMNKTEDGHTPGGYFTVNIEVTAQKAVDSLMIVKLMKGENGQKE